MIQTSGRKGFEQSDRVAGYMRYVGTNISTLFGHSSLTQNQLINSGVKII